MIKLALNNVYVFGLKQGKKFFSAVPNLDKSA